MVGVFGVEDGVGVDEVDEVVEEEEDELVELVELVLDVDELEEVDELETEEEGGILETDELETDETGTVEGVGVGGSLGDGVVEVLLAGEGSTATTPSTSDF